LVRAAVSLPRSGPRSTCRVVELRRQREHGKEELPMAKKVKHDEKKDKSKKEKRDV
jgi:hypothetical protein